MIMSKTSLTVFIITLSFADTGGNIAKSINRVFDTLVINFKTETNFKLLTNFERFLEQSLIENTVFEKKIPLETIF